jgi:FkbM family methyltransferase
MRQDITSLNKWFGDNGDYTHNINYELNNNSVVIDLGGYYGLWIDEILKKNNPYIPNIILVEPVPDFYNHLVTKYENYKKIKVMNVGVSTDKNETTKSLYVSNDCSSTNFNTNVNSVIQIKTLPIDKILSDNNINQVDLLQINIEGDEYALMEYMIESKIINKFKNIQIQFHLGIENDIERRVNIQKNLIYNGFKNKFDYPFVWESWEKNKM